VGRLGTFRDRRDAGRQLGEALREYKNRRDVLVLALPRGGVPVAYEVAKFLGCPLDVLVVRKLGVPRQEELAMGAIASGGVLKLNEELIQLMRLSPEEIRTVIQREKRELQRRERAYRGDRGQLEVHGKVVLLVDDGLATGSTMRAAISALRQLGPRRLVVAIPVGAIQSCRRILRDADDLVCLRQPEDLIAISLWYDDFGQTTDRDVEELLNQAVSQPLSAKVP
jgi:putative phosphoribosyl transferase